MLYGANPNDKHPLPGFPQICFIKNTVTNPKIIIGDYTYYDDPIDSENYERNVLYHYPFSKDKLIIGKFCALATGVKFVMNGANHKISGFSTYPFQIFGNGWEVVPLKKTNYRLRVIPWWAMMSGLDMNQSLCQEYKLEMAQLSLPNLL